MPSYDAKVFAEWLENSFAASSFKNYSALADAAKVTRATVSALVNAREQTLTGKASQPKRETVVKLAQVLNQDIDKALGLAGYAPENSAANIPESVKQAFAREGVLYPEDELHIANVVEILKNKNKHR